MVHHSPCRNTGFSMIEVLITMFVIAVAMLGTAALQAYSMKVNQGSQFRAQAVMLGTDLLERIEANNQAAIAGSYAATLPQKGAASKCAGTLCSPQEMALYDLSQVQEAMARQLPDSSGEITFAGAGPYTYTVQITWRERASRPSTSSGKTETFSYTVNRTVYDRSSAL